MIRLALDLKGLALLLQQQAPLADSLEQISRRPGSEFWAEAATTLRQGGSLQQALQKCPQLPVWLVAWIDQAVLHDPSQALRLAAHSLQGTVRRQREWSALWIYPNLLWAACLATGWLVLLLTPRSAISASQSFIVQINARLSEVFPALMLTPFLLALLLWIPDLRARLPILGGLARMRDALAVLGALPFLLPGHSLPEAMRLASQLCGVKPLRKQLEICADRQEAGSPLEQALGSVRLMPEMARWLLLRAEKAQFESRQTQSLCECLEQHIQFGETFAWNLFYLAFYFVMAGMIMWFLISLFLPLMQTVGGL